MFPPLTDGRTDGRTDGWMEEEREDGRDGGLHALGRKQQHLAASDSFLLHCVCVLAFVRLHVCIYKCVYVCVCVHASGEQYSKPSLQASYSLKILGFYI